MLHCALFNCSHAHEQRLKRGGVFMRLNPLGRVIIRVNIMTTDTLVKIMRNKDKRAEIWRIVNGGGKEVYATKIYSSKWREPMNLHPDYHSLYTATLRAREQLNMR